jgi:inosine-uridine nucleoside N-ribohydrolase
MMSTPYLSQHPIPVILDTDIGDDMDDTWALAMLLGCPQLDLKLITLAADDTPAKTRLVAKMLELTGETRIPLATGRKTSDKVLNLAHWLGDYTLTDYPGEVRDDAAGEIIKLINASPVPVTVIAIGPVCNLADALARDPAIAHKSRVIWMGGGIDIGYKGGPPEPEYNVYSGIPEAQALFASEWDITLVPIDACIDAVIRGDYFQRIRHSRRAWCRVVMETYESWANRPQYPIGESSNLYDAVAIYAAFSEEYSHVETMTLAIDDRGLTYRDPRGRTARVLMGWDDQPAFKNLVTEAILGELL